MDINGMMSPMIWWQFDGKRWPTKKIWRRISQDAGVIRVNPAEAGYRERQMFAGCLLGRSPCVFWWHHVPNAGSNRLFILGPGSTDLLGCSDSAFVRRRWNCIMVWLTQRKRNQMNPRMFGHISTWVKTQDGIFMIFHVCSNSFHTENGDKLLGHHGLHPVASDLFGPSSFYRVFPINLHCPTAHWKWRLCLSVIKPLDFSDIPSWISRDKPLCGGYLHRHQVNQDIMLQTSVGSSWVKIIAVDLQMLGIRWKQWAIYRSTANPCHCFKILWKSVLVGCVYSHFWIVQSTSLGLQMWLFFCTCSILPFDPSGCLQHCISNCQK